ncbi:MAG: MlaD family protein [Halioglobus sp.]
MSEKPQSAIIGAFIVGALLITISAIIFVSQTGLGSNREKIVMVFDGSVKGLTLGAPVALRGVQIGQVTDIELILNTDSIDVIMLVEAELSGENFRRVGSQDSNITEDLINSGLRAQLNTQSILTGLLYVQMDFHPDSKVQLADIDSEHVQIPTIPTELERFALEFQKIDFAELASDISDITNNIDRFVSNEAFQALPGDLRNSLKSLDAMTAELTDVLNANGPKLEQLLDSSTQTMVQVRTDLPQLSASAEATLQELNTAAAAFEQAMQGVTEIVSDDSSTRYQLDIALKEIASASRALQLLARTLEERPDALIRGKREETR